MPEHPGVPQKVKFFDAGMTWIAGSAWTVERISAILFDQWIIGFFKDIEDIDRAKWEIADRLWAINSVLSQVQERKEKGQPYIRRDILSGRGFLLTAINIEQEV